MMSCTQFVLHHDFENKGNLINENGEGFRKCTSAFVQKCDGFCAKRDVIGPAVLGYSNTFHVSFRQTVFDVFMK